MTAARATRLAWVFLWGLTAFRVWYTGTLPLAEDEAYYWQWSRHLDWGYYDSGPMIAWVIAAGQWLMGPGERGVRLGVALMGLGMGAAILAFCRTVAGGARLGLGLVLAANGAALFAVGSVIATYDTPQAFFWLWGLVFAAQAIFGGRPSRWYWAGVASACSVLSKYSSALLPVGILGFLLVSPAHRFWLRRREPWLATALMAIICLPNLLWNARHHWAAVAHTLGRAGDGRWKFTTFEFWGGQAGLLSPILFGLLIWGMWLAWRRARGGDALLAFLLWSALPMLALMTLLSAQTRVQANWAAPGWLGGMLAAGLVLEGRLAVSRRLRRWAVAGLVLAYVLVVPVYFHRPLLAWLSPPADLDPLARLYGWPRMGQEVEMALAELPAPKPFLYSLKYQMASLTAFYTPGQPETWQLFMPGDRLSSYLFWGDPAQLKGRDGLAVIEGRRDDLDRLFASVREIKRLAIIGPSGQVIHNITLYHCQGFRGADGRPPEWR